MISARTLTEKEWTIKELTDDEVPLVEGFITSLGETDQKKVLRQIQHTADNGPHKSREKFRKVQGDIFEMKPSKQVRIFCSFDPEKRKTILLTNGCVKKTNRHNSQDVKRAERLCAAYKEGTQQL